MEKSYLIPSQYKEQEYFFIKTLEANNEISFEEYQCDIYDSNNFVITPKTLSKTIKYSYDKFTWYDYTQPITLENINDYIYFKGNNIAFDSCYYNSDASFNGCTFKSTKKCDVGGRILSLITGSVLKLTSASTFFGCTAWSYISWSSSALKCLSIFEKLKIVSAENLSFYGFNTQNYKSTWYSCLFANQTDLKYPPRLATGDGAGFSNIDTGPYDYMFYNCSSLEKLPNITWYSYWNSSGHGIDDYAAHMFDGCTKIKLSTTQTEEYANEYKCLATYVNSSNTMFANTGGTFTGPIQANTTYYTSNEVVPLLNNMRT